MMVRTANKMVRAISLGVFCRLAPSTKVIMRSRKVWPRSAVMRTTMRSERTLVPPVTAERSPPDSRMTGADSPVMADSSTEAMPSMISPSDGMRSFASQTTRSPLFNSAAGTSSSVPSALSRRAAVSERILRRVSACALPRPSAIASAKLAKITVRKSQIVIDQLKVEGWAIASTKVTMEPTSTTNMTGLRICTARVELGDRVDQSLAEDRAVEEALRLGDAVRRAGRPRLGWFGGRHGHEKSAPWLVIRRTRG